VFHDGLTWFLSRSCLDLGLPSLMITWLVAYVFTMSGESFLGIVIVQRSLWYEYVPASTSVYGAPFLTSPTKDRRKHIFSSTASFTRNSYGRNAILIGRRELEYSMLHSGHACRRHAPALQIWLSFLSKSGGLYPRFISDSVQLALFSS
jgi:hypothetical protein